MDKSQKYDAEQRELDTKALILCDSIDMNFRKD